MSPDMRHQFLTRAIQKAQESVDKGGFPAGSLVVKNGQIIGEGISIGNIVHDPTSHSDIASIRDVCQKQSTTDLSGATLYSSMQPCVMCLGATMWSGIETIVYACAMGSVSAEYYGGHYDSQKISAQFLQPIELMHVTELEEQSLAIVKQWERSLG